MSALADWLDSHGLGALHTVLEAQQIDIDVLPDLNEDDLKGLGIALGPRRRLLRAIAGAFPASAHLRPTPTRPSIPPSAASCRYCSSTSSARRP